MRHMPQNAHSCGSGSARLMYPPLSLTPTPQNYINDSCCESCCLCFLIVLSLRCDTPFSSSFLLQSYGLAYLRKRSNRPELFLPAPAPRARPRPIYPRPPRSSATNNGGNQNGGGGGGHEAVKHLIEFAMSAVAACYQTQAKIELDIRDGRRAPPQGRIARPPPPVRGPRRGPFFCFPAFVSSGRSFLESHPWPINPLLVNFEYYGRVIPPPRSFRSRSSSRGRSPW